ncbi:hypothetical protein [Paenibacillus pectinilyticus]|uniref:hypothetical protein n=1 Tax=Paenibacillus pectinilyticus TaxID=512399 RepID=UPI001428932F|nr:hypothetical protein [Paenibacillus pectinilyticus]
MASIVTEDNDFFCYRYDHDVGGWHEDDTITLYEYEGKETFDSCGTFVNIFTLQL